VDVPEGSDSTGGDDQEPQSPWPTEEIEFMKGDDELLAVRLRGAPHVGETTIDLDVAGPFLFRLHQLVHAIATAIQGRYAGRRGSLPDVEGAGLLSLIAVDWGASVTFHFGLGYGERMRLDEESITEASVKELQLLLEATVLEQDDQLFKRTRALGQRVGTDYGLLMNTLSSRHVESVWRPRTTERPVRLYVPKVRWAKEVLDLEGNPQSFEEPVTGLLYRADSKSHEFILEPIDREEEKIQGTYDPALREEIRDAWDKVVRVKLLTTHHFLRRQIDPSRVDVELLSVDEILDDDDLLV
jgi:hypothetical protein